MHTSGRCSVAAWLAFGMEQTRAPRPLSAALRHENPKADLNLTPAEKNAKLSGNRYADYWCATCTDYWRGCLSCQDSQLYHLDETGKPYALRSDFCRRHAPLQSPQQGRLQ
jgi:hypothetical protein